MGLSEYVLVISTADGRSSESSMGIQATIVGIDAAFGSSMMALRTSRAPRMQAGQVGERSVRNRPSPFFALNAARTGASVDAGVRSVSAAVGLSVESAFVRVADGSGVDFFESHPRIESANANATTL